MFKNYLKVALRNILKYKMFSFINVFGLALAMSVCLLVILMLADQNRYDKFNTKIDRIYRITTKAPTGKQPYATSPSPLGAYLKSNYPNIEEIVTMVPNVTGDAQAGERVTEIRGYFTEPSFFRVFDFELEKGNRETALTEARSVVISKEAAELLFPGEEAVGKTINFFDRKLSFPVEFDGIGSKAVDWGSFTVTGVVDGSKYKSHLKFSVLMSAATLPTLYPEKKVEDNTDNWNWFFRTYTYAMMRDDRGVDDLNTALADAAKRNEPNIQQEHAKGLTFVPQALADIQLGLLGNDTNSRLPIQGYYFLAALAIIIMVLACLNYTSLSIARALTRAKEIGIRKVTGAYKSALVTQFLGESIVVSLIALVMSVVFLQLLRPAFMSLWLNKFLGFELPSDPMVYMMFVGFALFCGIVAGVYPAFRMSAYQPIAALKKHEGTRLSSGRLRKVLSVSQFCVSLLFITTSILIFNQFRHYIAFDYGMNTENIVNLSLQGVDYRKAANEISQVPGVVSVSATDLLPATGRSNGAELRKPGTEEYTRAWIMSGDENFFENVGVKLIAGRQITPSSDSLSTPVIVNATLVQALGHTEPSQMIGEVLESKWAKHPYVVVGVVEDFRHQLLINTDKIGPLVITNLPSSFSYLNVRVSTNNIPALIAGLKAKWKVLDPAHDLQYEFYNDELAVTHQALFDVVSILGFIAFLAIVIACLGLLGMATYMAERRKKEVGIRKVLGAADWGITMLLSKTFLKVLSISIIIGAPMSWFINNLWLQYLPNRVEFGPGTVIIASMLLLMLGLITIGSQTMRASRSNPADVLKEE